MFTYLNKEAYLEMNFNVTKPASNSAFDNFRKSVCGNPIASVGWQSTMCIKEIPCSSEAYERGVIHVTEY